MNKPLAIKLAPKSLKDVLGQEHLIGKGKIPAQLYKDFIENKESKNLGNIKPIFKGDYKLTNLNNIFPEYISSSLKEAITYFDKKIKGFADDDAIIIAPETRSSSAVRILRNKDFESNIKGIYPIGEGAGYAGGITSSALDGLKCAISISNKNI